MAQFLQEHRGIGRMPALLQGHLTDRDEATRSGASLPAAHRSARPALSIYVHIPFCMQKCGYCDFNAYLYREALARAYLAALRQEIMHTAAERRWEGYSVPSVYLGG